MLQTELTQKPYLLGPLLGVLKLLIRIIKNTIRINIRTSKIIRIVTTR